MPHPDSISLADALAFDSFTEEQKRIAFAGVALHERTEAQVEAARREGFDAGLDAGRAECCVMAEHETDLLLVQLREISDRIVAVRNAVAGWDTRHAALGEIDGLVARTIAFVEGDR